MPPKILFLSAKPVAFYREMMYNIIEELYIYQTLDIKEWLL